MKIPFSKPVFGQWILHTRVQQLEDMCRLTMERCHGMLCLLVIIQSEGNWWILSKWVGYQALWFCPLMDKWWMQMQEERWQVIPRPQNSHGQATLISTPIRGELFSILSMLQANFHLHLNFSNIAFPHKSNDLHWDFIHQTIQAGVFLKQHPDLYPTIVPVVMMSGLAEMTKSEAV